VKIKGKYISCFGYLYIALPPLLFLVGWSAPLWAAVFGLSVAVSLWLCLSRDGDDYPDLPVDRTFFAVIAVIAVMVFLSGIGGHAYQNYDVPYRNQMFATLVSEKWPVQRELFLDGSTQTRGFIYYIGFWLVPAAVGKLLGLKIGFLALEIWAGLGVLLTWYHIGRYTNRFRLWHLLLFFCFGGLDMIGWLSNRGIFYLGSHIEWWCGYQFSSFTTQLFWVYNQAVYAWVITLMILQSRKNNHLVFIWSTGLLSCTLPFAGMLPYVLYRIAANYKASEKRLRAGVCELFSFQNVVGGGVIGIVTFLYLAGNVSAQQVQSISGGGISVLALLEYFKFVILEVVVYFLLIWGKKHDALFYLTAGILLICPLIRVGSSQDFCMRASIPALLVLLLQIIETLQSDCLVRADRLARKALIVVLCLGAVSSVNEVSRSLIKSPEIWESYGLFAPEVVPEDVMYTGANFSGNVEDNIYYRYFAKTDS